MTFHGTWEDALTVFCSLTFLILVTILFELGKERLCELVRNQPMQPIVETLFGELMVLGFIGLISFVVSKSGMLKELSHRVYNCASESDHPDEHRRRLLMTEEEECDQKITEAFETLHMMLFLTMVLFLCQVLIFIWLGMKEQRRWKEAEQMARRHNPDNPAESMVVSDFREARNKRRRPDGTVRKPNHWNPCEYAEWSEWWELRYRFTYQRMRQNFIDPPGKPKDKLPATFAYHHYLSERMGQQVAEIVEVPISTWVGLEGLLCVFLFVLVAIDNDIKKLIFIWLALEYTQLALYIYLWTKFSWIKSMLGGHGAFHDGEDEDEQSADMLARVNGSKPSPPNSTSWFSGGRDKSELEHPILSQEIVSVNRSGALYLDSELNPIQPRSWLERTLLGNHLPDKHQNLFWGYQHGAHYAEHVIRWILLINAIYLAFFCYFFIPFMVSSEQGYSSGVIVVFFFGSLLAPFLITAVLTPHALRLYVHVSSVELMKDKNMINQTNARQKTQSTITMLKMIDTMASHCRRLEMQEEVTPEEAQRRLDHLSMADVKDIKRMFKMIDVDQSGHLSLNEIGVFLCSLGMKDANPKQILKEIDTSGDGLIQLPEFLQWMAIKKIADHDTQSDEKMIRRIFEMFDTDGSGIIGTKELLETLCKFGQTLDPDEVHKLVTEFDEDGDGSVNLEEFEDLMHKSLGTRA
eukprot:TRINITY_DN4774_c0_g2_i1.p1 TRINITY_DN4774_c0_g2~~TRINITY_DN4774_c0_g2_i1.p1  ORF type:complete len:693 (-),score=164.97 TRINITY_DN4774_c0_g2_i1:984-3062(-)